MKDISDRKQVEKQLRLLESVVVNTNDAVIISDAEPIDEPGPRIIYVNEAFLSKNHQDFLTALNQYGAVDQNNNFPNSSRILPDLIPPLFTQIIYS